MFTFTLIDMWSSHNGQWEHWECGVMGVVVLATAEIGQAMSSYRILNLVGLTRVVAIKQLPLWSVFVSSN